MSFDVLRASQLIGKLTGADKWHEWKSDIEATFSVDESWKWISGAEKLPEKSDELKAANEKLRNAAYVIVMTCDAAHRSLVQGKSATEMYKKLKTQYEGDTPAKRMELRRQLYRLEHDPANPVMNFINDIRLIVADLTAINHAPKADEIRDITLMNLHSSFEVIRTILVSQENNDGVEWTLDSLGDKLIAFESSSRLARGEPAFNTASAFAARAGRFNRDARSQRPSASDNWCNTQQLRDVCVRCGNHGHYAQYCFREMPEYVKNRIRHGQIESANIASVHHPLAPKGSLTLSTLRTALDTGHTVSFYPSNGVVFKGDDIVGKINYSGDKFSVQKYHIPRSYAAIEDGDGIEFGS